MQTCTDVAAHFLEYFPVGHNWQLSDPTPANFPLLHSLHEELLSAPSRSEYVPALHSRQLELDDIPTVAEKVPTRHF